MEEEAVHSFEEIYRRSHKNVKISECGLCLCREMPFVGGSPDRMVSCSCCGKFCLEVKCPFSIRHTTPVDPQVHLPYLKRRDDQLVLNENHKYHTQCQIQMAATEISQGYFFVWTAHGTFLQKLAFKEDFWCKLKDVFAEFYKEFYVPYLFFIQIVNTV